MKGPPGAAGRPRRRTSWTFSRSYARAREGRQRDASPEGGSGHPPHALSGRGRHRQSASEDPQCRGIHRSPIDATERVTEAIAAICAKGYEEPFPKPSGEEPRNPSGMVCGTLPGRLTGTFKEGGSSGEIDHERVRRTPKHVQMRQEKGGDTGGNRGIWLQARKVRQGETISRKFARGWEAAPVLGGRPFFRPKGQTFG